MTVAHIREPNDAAYVEVVFLESTRFYRLRKDSPGYDGIQKRLSDALTNGHTVNVRFASPDSDLIADVVPEP